jgi:acyl-CoA thioesterase YciA
MNLPEGCQPTLRVVTRTMDANPGGNIFGGWLMAQIDIAGSIPAIKQAQGRVATVAVNHIQFLQPLWVHDVVSLYANVVNIGVTSLTVAVEVYAERTNAGCVQILKAAHAKLTYVALDEQGKKRIIVKP